MNHMSGKINRQHHLKFPVLADARVDQHEAEEDEQKQIQLRTERPDQAQLCSSALKPHGYIPVRHGNGNRGGEKQPENDEIPFARSVIQLIDADIDHGEGQQPSRAASM